MSGRILKISEKIPEKGRTSMAVAFRSENHEIHFWRVLPGDWIYPHIHPENDDIWYILEGTGDYYISAEDTKRVGPGDIAAAVPGDVHGIFNSGTEDLIVYSVLSPLPVEMEAVSGFEYPE